MSNRWTHEDVANYQAKRGLKIEIVDEPVVKIDREVKHDYKAEFEQQLELVGIQVEKEYAFDPDRRWRSDYRIGRVLVEFEGGLFKGRKAGHSSVRGILRDIEKANAATLLGFTLIRIAPPHVRSGQALKWVEEALRTEVK